ncbi:hypothetical protein [Lactiplantibacillus daowaiensis]|uniref:Uncharacterized protein n=1 Tax=Lactiplantibacillus daowaiensis TaxID=2559918 RepID=A0ABW1RX87_9LACO|nr:hypothetical protein [Lactiplantibacillus daowaiensis]
MIAFVRIEDSSVDVKISYTEVAEKVWGFQYSHIPIFVNHDNYGIDSNDGFFLSFSLFLSDYTKRWLSVKGSWDSTTLTVRQVKGNSDQIVVMSGFEQELLINQKGFYNLVAYLAKRVNGEIMVGENGDWVSLAAFTNQYRKIMTTPFAEAVNKSIEYGSQYAPGKEEPGMDRYFF